MRIAIAEDNEIALKAICSKLEKYPNVELLFWAQNGLTLLERLKEQRPDLILMDIEMPQMDGIAACMEVNALYPMIQIAMLTTFDDDDKIFKAILAGAKGYLLKDESAENIYSFMQMILQGGAAMSPSIAMRAMNYIRESKSETLVEKEEHLLSPRETEILIEIKNALSNKQIADKLFISEGTVRKHVENIYRKLQVNNKISAINQAQSKNII